MTKTFPLADELTLSLRPKLILQHITLKSLKLVLTYGTFLSSRENSHISILKVWENFMGCSDHPSQFDLASFSSILLCEFYCWKLFWHFLFFFPFTEDALQMETYCKYLAVVSFCCCCFEMFLRINSFNPKKFWWCLFINSLIHICA